MIYPIAERPQTELNRIELVRGEWVLGVYQPLAELGSDYHFVNAPVIGTFDFKTSSRLLSFFFKDSYKLAAELSAGRTDHSSFGPARMEAPVPGMLSSLITGSDILPALRAGSTRVQEYVPFVERLMDSRV